MPRCDAEGTYEAVIQAFEAIDGLTSRVLLLPEVGGARLNRRATSRSDLAICIRRLPPM